AGIGGVAGQSSERVRTYGAKIAARVDGEAASTEVERGLEDGDPLAGLEVPDVDRGFELGTGNSGPVVGGVEVSNGGEDGARHIRASYHRATPASPRRPDCRTTARPRPARAGPTTPG